MARPVQLSMAVDTTARKDLPSQDVALAGGWATVRMVEEVYTQADEHTTLGVVLHEARVREAK